MTQNSFNGGVNCTFLKSPPFLIDVRYGFARVSASNIPAGAGFNPVKLGFPGYMQNGQALMFPSFSATSGNALDSFPLGAGSGTASIAD